MVLFGMLFINLLGLKWNISIVFITVRKKKKNDAEEYNDEDDEGEEKE